MKYSSADLLGEELLLLSGEISWKEKFILNLFKTKKVSLVLKIPQSYLSRSIIICDDIERVTGVPVSPHMILDILVRDFINELARQNNGPLPAFRYLMDRYSKKLQVAHYQSRQVEEFDLYEKPSEVISSFKVDVSSKEVLRMEWFLSDLEEQVEDHGFTVEKCMEIIFCNHVEMVKKGEGEKAIKEIIKAIMKEN